MFTGLTLGLGEIIKKNNKMGALEFTIKPQFNWGTALLIGESIAVSGCCLTVEKILNDSVFTAYASDETLKITNLADVKFVNLERALRLSDRLGGHLVSGHVDGLALISSITAIGLSYEFKFEVDVNLMKFIIPKGSVTLDGVSLTVNNIINNTFTVNVIPETMKVTTLAFKKTADKVNLEVDLVGKYLYQFISMESSNNLEKNSKLSLKFLQENGFY